MHFSRHILTTFGIPRSIDVFKQAVNFYLSKRKNNPLWENPISDSQMKNNQMLLKQIQRRDSKMKTIMINTYSNSFSVPQDWLLANTQEQTADEFLNNYTWDEGEWLFILYSIEKDEKEIQELTKLLKQGFSLFKKENQEGIVHANSKGNVPV